MHTGVERRLAARVFCAGLGLGLAACGAAADGDDGLGRSGWFGSCESDAECREGQCLCGVCTASCAESPCAGGPPNAVCLDATHWAQVGLCAGRSTAAVCASSCADEIPCARGLDCVDGICLPGPVAAIAVAGGHGPVGSLCETDPVVWRSLEVSDQRQINALRGCEQIVGDLTLDVFAGVEPDALRSLRSVTGRLTVTNENGGVPEPLRGLEGIEQLGSLALRGLTLPSLASLSQLTTIRASDDRGRYRAQPGSDDPQRGGIEIANCTGLRSLVGLDNLEEVGFLSLLENPELETLAGLSRLREIQDVTATGGILTDLRGLEQVSLRRSLRIASTRGFSSFQGLGETSQMTDLVLYGNAALTDLRGLAVPRVMNSVSLEANAAMLDLAGLRGVEEVGDLSVSGAFTSLEGLAPSLQAGSLDITESPGLTSLRGLGEASIQRLSISRTGLADLNGLAEATVGAALSVSVNERLTTLAGLPGLGADASVEIYECRQLANFDAFERVTRLGKLSIAGTIESELDGLVNLQRVVELNIDRNVRLQQLDGISGLGEVRSMTITRNPELRTLPVFPRLASAPASPDCVSCGFQISLVANEALVQGPVFPALTRADSIVLSYLVSLEAIAGFPALRSATSIALYSNKHLATLEFGSLEAVGSLNIAYNPALGDAAWLLLERAAAPGGADIVSNRGGMALLDPCPWLGDSVCDEANAYCAPGTDVTDCTAAASGAEGTP